MKKIISAFILCAMLCALLVPSAFADDGMILFQDNFESGELNGLDWENTVTLFTVEGNGPTGGNYLEGWRAAVVQQTSYGDDAPAPRTYSANIAFKVDAWFFEDGGDGAGGDGSGEHWLGLWWADHFEPDHIGLDADRIVYTLRVYYEQRKVKLIAYGENAGKEYFPESTVLSEYEIPESEPLVMDPSDPTVFNFGMRLNGNQIDGFFNNQKVVSFTAPRMGDNKCPLLLWNNQCWCGFDNFVVSTANYNLFNEADINSPPVNSNPYVQPVVTTDEEGNYGVVTTNGDGQVVTTNAGTTAPVTQIVKEVVEKVVHSTDAEGNDITEIETEIVEKTVTQAPQANTNTNTPTASNGGSQTGDMAIVVVTVMVIALGTALVVKKIGDHYVHQD